MLKRFRAPVWAWGLTVAGVALFATLGHWQWGKGVNRQEWLAQFQADGGAGVTLTRNTLAVQQLQLLRASATGVYWTDRQLLQDGQSREGRPGFHVWTPLRLRDGALLLVNRGWMAQPQNLKRLPQPPVPEGEVRIVGWWRSLPEPAIRVGEDDCRNTQSFPVVVVYPRQEQIQCLMGESVLPGLLLLDAREPDGFVREWSAGGLPPERHFGYAVTWYALAVTAVILFASLNWKRRDQSQN
ncbi:MAG: SURF1 family protein [Nevskiales bacterium]|nr:SURF1 family protein [Nevskiales bacterium]